MDLHGEPVYVLRPQTGDDPVKTQLTIVIAMLGLVLWLILSKGHDHQPPALETSTHAACRVELARLNAALALCKQYDHDH